MPVLTNVINYIANAVIVSGTQVVELVVEIGKKVLLLG